MNLPSLAAIDNRPLASLARTGLDKMFHSWIGASGRRYVCSVYSINEPPAFDYRRAIVAAVRRTQPGATIAFIFEPRDLDDFELSTRRARAAGAEQWHVHLLADTPEARAFVVRDLCPARRIVA
jgi:hypothetical protein